MPEITVSCSSCVCQCGAILYPPAGAKSLITNGPSLRGSPWSTAIFAPLGSDGGASPHLMSVGVMKLGAPPVACAMAGPANIVQARTPMAMRANALHAIDIRPPDVVRMDPCPLFFSTGRRALSLSDRDHMPTPRPT